MRVKSEQGRSKLTAKHKRQGKRSRGVANAAVDGTRLTAKRVTRAYKTRARQCENKACRKLFTPKAKHGRFCCDPCRQTEARRRKKKGLKLEVVERDLELVTCLFCNNTFFGQKGSHAKYCSDSHKELAYRQRRASTISAISESTGMSLGDANELVQNAGMPNCTRWLRQQGMSYNDSLRRWLAPISTDAYLKLGA